MGGFTVVVQLLVTSVFWAHVGEAGVVKALAF